MHRTLAVLLCFIVIILSSASVAAQTPNDTLSNWEKEWQTLAQELKQEIWILEQQIEELAAVANKETQTEREELQRQLKKLNHEFQLILQKSKVQWEALSQEIKQRMEAAEKELDEL